MRLRWMVLGALLAGAVGCGSAASPSHPAVKTPAPAKAAPHTAAISEPPVIVGAAQWKDLPKFQAAVKANPNSATAWSNLAHSEFVNNNPAQALQAYLKAAQLDPKDGILDNDIGNLYNYTFKEPQKALPYYQEAVKKSPSYDYGWYNLILLEKNLGNTAAVKQYQAEALKAVPPSDKLYKYLQQGY
ncbi:MAG: tetratricopeptide repeat protein [Firmicutes bacterium]|nr:tetratricopeptide repeat protein [Alicyclobacillaceae bacterium]MCL6498162.1 tetratricopeptide repeat protein [Bacillota bacterium]